MFFKEMTSRKCFSVFACAVLMGFTCAVPAEAGVAVVDFNVFDAGVASGQAGGTGFDAGSTWGTSGTLNVVAGDLTSDNYTLTQTGTGQSMQGDYFGPRYVYRPFTTAMEGEIWFSALVNVLTDEVRGGLVFNGTDSATLDNAFFFMGNTNIRTQSGDSTSAGRTDVAVNVALNDTLLIVGRLDTDASKLTVWVDPDLVSTPNIAGHTPTFDITMDLETLTTVGVMSYEAGAANGQGKGALIDHVRFSDTATAFADVTGVPEPASLVLMGLGALVMLRRRKDNV